MKAKPIMLTLNKVLTRLQHLLNDAGFPATLAFPRYEPHEIDEARFTAVELMKQLSTPAKDEAEEKAARRRALTSIFMFQMTVDGILEFMKAQKMAKPQPQTEEK